ncbi:hypothetical protein SV7mr_41630 [Stieleria bergensis]|uniref:Uncharacterized protein n=1 Tax=Stieleria bergensis TaxID=2528025 RepID=A0A517SZQ5_9BACT|nr:hypothetical protein SV7mr_41630 [Planctomycetes bacterium SV_7m_r]
MAFAPSWLPLPVLVAAGAGCPQRTPVQSRRCQSSWALSSSEAGRTGLGRTGLGRGAGACCTAWTLCKWAQGACSVAVLPSSARPLAASEDLQVPERSRIAAWRWFPVRRRVPVRGRMKRAADLRSAALCCSGLGSLVAWIEMAVAAASPAATPSLAATRVLPLRQVAIFEHDHR